MKVTLEKINNMLKERNINVDILYITQYGSKLYGTNNENSDDDYKVIFLPKLEDLILGESPKSFSISTGTDDKKNNSDDVDIEFYSIQYWMKNLRKGETGALDILFSIFREDTQIYINKDFESRVKKDYKQYFTATNSDSYLRYALAQANTYCIKGNRLNVLKNIVEFLNKNVSESDYIKRLKDFIPLMHNLLDNEYCRLDESHVTILGKKHFLEIYMEEFVQRITSLYERYGHRAHKAASNDGFDFKAISHALRTCIEFEELLTSEFIHFPLKDANLIKKIKYGQIDKEKCTEIVLNRIDGAAELLRKFKESNINTIKYNKKIADRLILDFWL